MSKATTNWGETERSWAKLIWTCCEIEKHVAAFHASYAGAGFTEAMFRVLLVVDEQGPSTMPKIARLADMARQSAQRACKQLLERGEIVLRENPDHKKSKFVEMTEAGRKTIELAYAARRFGRSVPNEDVQRALNVLRELNEGLEKAATD
jgi:DNA-binding MarR family transcriptional regulator